KAHFGKATGHGDSGARSKEAGRTPERRVHQNLPRALRSPPFALGSSVTTALFPVVPTDACRVAPIVSSAMPAPTPAIVTTPNSFASVGAVPPLSCALCKLLEQGCPLYSGRFPSMVLGALCRPTTEPTTPAAPTKPTPSATNPAVRSPAAA